MATISVSTIEDTTLFNVEGEFTLQEVSKAAHATYVERSPKRVLWDFTAATTRSLNPDELRELARSIKKTADQVRHGGVTAFVSNDPGVFSLLCMYALVATMEDMPVEQSIFKTREEALVWLRTLNAA